MTLTRSEPEGLSGLTAGGAGDDQFELVPVDSRLDGSLFSVKNVPQWSDTLFVAPRIHVRGNKEQGRTAPKKLADGRVALGFELLLADSQAAVAHAGIEAVLKERHASVLAPLPGCLKKVVLVTPLREYEASLVDASASPCRLGEVYRYEWIMSAAEARDVLESDLHAGALDVRGTYEMRVPWAVSRYAIEFDRERLYAELEASFAPSGGILPERDASGKVLEVLQRLSFSLSIDEDLTPRLKSIARKVEEAFFVNTGRCGGVEPCVRLSRVHEKAEQLLREEWERAVHVPSGQDYLAWARLRPVEQSELTVKGSVSGTGVATALSLVAGDLIKLSISDLLREQRNYEVTSFSQADNVVCTRSEPVMRRDCRWVAVGRRGDRETELRCRDTHVGDRCTASENRWVQTTIYAMSEPKEPLRLNPFEVEKELLDGMKLRFVWRNEDGEVTREALCPLSVFDRSRSEKGWRIRLENRPKCDAFSDMGKKPPRVELLNHVRFPVTHKQGRLVKRWDGAISESPVDAIHEPPVRLDGVLSILGYDFTTAASGGHRLVR